MITPTTIQPPLPWIAAMPKVELHLHLEGSLSPATVGLLAQRHQSDPTEIWPNGLPEKFSFDGFPDFARQFNFGLRQIKTGDDLETTVLALAAQLASDNVRYAEVTTTVFTHLHSGMPAADYGQALSRGRSRAMAEHGVDLSWVIDIPRDLEMPDSTVTIDFLASANVPAGVIGIGLGGYEVGFPPEPYAEHFARAKALGLRSLPHAGETEGPASITGALDVLGAERIGHGVRCLEDPALVTRLSEDGVMLEVCPTSNLLLQVVESLEAHPLRALIDADVRVCLNTDDPGMFATDINNELMIAHQLHQCSPDDLVVMQMEALAASYASDITRDRLRTELKAYRAKLKR